MQAEIITIGDEILIGQIVDTNSAFISKQLNKIGVSVYHITSIQDDKQHILQALQDAEHNADIIIITGGLGPTKDDITKKTLAAYFQDTSPATKMAFGYLLTDQAYAVSIHGFDKVLLNHAKIFQIMINKSFKLPLFFE